MLPTALRTDDLLDPISADKPAGEDLRWTPEWDRIKEARRADDSLDSGKWAKKDSKTAEWRLVQELASRLIREQSKDLQLALWLTEANVKLEGFAGLQEGLRLTRELMARYWDSGLFPSLEEGPDDRAGPFDWLNEKLTPSLAALPITKRTDGGEDYSFNDFRQAVQVGSEASWKTADGEIDDNKKKEFDKNIKDGKISRDIFEQAVRATTRAPYEDFHSVFQQAHQEFKELEKQIAEKFGDAAPNLSACRTALSEIKQEIENILERKRREEPNPVALTGSEGTDGKHSSGLVFRFPLSLATTQDLHRDNGGSWYAAELLIQSGQVDQGLAEMKRLAASETSGRGRFQRKLLLAEICLTTRRERLARSILEELAEQIDKFQLEAWESSDLIGSVWTRLYSLYTQAGAGSSDVDRAEKLYERLCRLDPWQALTCGEA